jgi:hypothetical protein
MPAYAVDTWLAPNCFDDRSTEAHPMALAMNLTQAAAELGVKRRWLMEWLRGRPCDRGGVPFYRIAGKEKLFTESDLKRILAALPQPEPIRRGPFSGQFGAGYQMTTAEALKQLDRVVGGRKAGRKDNKRDREEQREAGRRSIAAAHEMMKEPAARPALPESIDPRRGRHAPRIPIYPGRKPTE